jgi:4-hydroxyisophthalate hydroxylase
MGEVTQRYQVVIVGAGPVGIALAVDLGQRDISVAVVERGREVGRLPKGQSLTHRTLEHFYFWDCLDEIRNIRLLPPGYPIGGVMAYGSLASDYWHPYGGSRDQLDPYYFQKNDRLPQYLTETVLRRRASELPSVDVFFDHAVRSICQDDEAVQVQASASVWPYDNLMLEADFVVGCDGTGSTVLAQLGIERQGTDFDTRMVLAVFDSPEFHAELERFGKRTTFHAVNPEMRGAWQFWGRIEAENSFFFHAPVPKDTRPGDVDAIHRIMERAAGFSFTAEYRDVGFWSLRTSVADTYRDRRVFIAGDAAHSHPPYGGYGLNTGLEDVANLGWKLAATLGGWGFDVLLDSYTAERQPVAAGICEGLIAAGIRAEVRFCEKYNPDENAAAFEEAWPLRVSAESDAPLTFEPHYEGSPVVCGPADATVGVNSAHSLRARPGHHLAPQTLSSGRDVFEELGAGYTLLALDANDADVNAVETAARDRGVPLEVVRDSLAGGRERYGSSMIMVRPDQFVAWTGGSAAIDDLFTTAWRTPSLR